jgi:hypothetical protein
MNADKYPSLLLIRFSVAILTLVFITGIAEVACLAFYAHKITYSQLAETERSLSKPATNPQPEKSAMLILSQKALKQ